jgi:uncharacterized Zn-binding protein involved in type VI secretion
MTKPAARVGDNHTCPKFEGSVPHVEGLILPPGSTTTTIGGFAAARITDFALCIGALDIISEGAKTVLFDCLPAARLGDKTIHGGVIVTGDPTVLIGGPTISVTNEFEDMSVAQVQMAMKARVQASNQIDAAIDALEAAKTTPDSTVDKYFSIDGTSEEDLENLDTLIENYKKMQADLGDVGFEGEAQTIAPDAKKYTDAYVRTLPLIHGVGDVHLMFEGFDLGTDRHRAGTVVHEMSHYSLGTDDEAYDWEPEFATLTQDEQMNNGDSYGEFAAAVSPC